MFQVYLAIFTTFDILRHICPHLAIFWQIQGISRILVQLHIFMYIKSYSEPVTYSSIIRTADIFSQFKTLLKSNS